VSRTLLLCEVFPPRTGGSGRWLWEVYRRLPPETVSIVAGTTPGDEAFDRKHGLNVVRLPLSFTTWGMASWAGFRQYTSMWWKLRRIVRRDHVTAIHCSKCLPEGWLAWLLRRSEGLPYLCYVHGEELNLAGQSRELAWLTRRVLNGAGFVIANSRNTQQILETWSVPPARIHVLNPGVDTEQFRPALPDETVQQRLGWQGRTVVLTVGRLQKRKGHDHLIRVLPRIRRAVPNVLYAVVGDGEEKGALEALVKSEGMGEHVRFHGELADDDLIRCYQQCDLFVLPNRQVGQDIEGFGMVLVEAQACGRPVVAGTSGGTAETMQAPVTGRLVDAANIDALGELLSELLTDRNLRERMGEAGRQQAVARFDWSALTEQARRHFAALSPASGERSRGAT
jgi:phosphatidylinositol alpha-1,6-mannosyltransferase